MDEYLTRENIMIGSAGLVVVLIIAVVVYKMTKKDRYTYTGGTPASTTNTVGTSTTWPTVVLGNAPVPTPSTLIGSSLIADEAGNLSITAAVPIGAILMWCGNSAPAGWAMCDGTNGTPDLTGRFIVGINGKNSAGLTALQPGDIGGEEFHQLRVEEMPSHGHSPGEACESECPLAGAGFIKGGSYKWITTGGDSTNSNKTLPHNNMPPFYALAYIMKMM